MTPSMFCTFTDYIKVFGWGCAAGFGITALSIWMIIHILESKK